MQRVHPEYAHWHEAQPQPYDFAPAPLSAGIRKPRAVVPDKAAPPVARSTDRQDDWGILAVPSPLLPQQVRTSTAVGGGAPAQATPDTSGNKVSAWFSNLRPIPLENAWYEKWAWLCTLAALLTGWVAPFLMAWEGTSGLDAQTWTIIQWVLVAIFLCDAASKFVLEYEDPNTGMRVADFKKIAINYAKTMMLPDFLYVVPWSQVFLAALDIKDTGSDTSLLVGLLRLLQLGRMYRFSAFVAMLEYRMVLPQTALVIWRNNLYVLGSSHVAGCLFFLIARLEGFGPGSWIGRHSERFEGLNVFGQYVYSLYFALAAFTGLGDNDFYMASVAEACVMGLFLLFNMLLSAYILGTVTMLMVKSDKRMKQFRDRITNLRAYSHLHSLPERLRTAMERHTELHFLNDQASDEQVLSIYPQTIRRRVLRFLYQDALQSCYLFQGCSWQFLELVLTASRLEQFMPHEQLVAEGDSVSEIYILLEGQAEVTVGNRLPPHLRQLLDKGPAQTRSTGRALSTAALKRAKTAHSKIGPQSNPSVLGHDLTGSMSQSGWHANSKSPYDGSATAAAGHGVSQLPSPFHGSRLASRTASRFGSSAQVNGSLHDNMLQPPSLHRSPSYDSIIVSESGMASSRASRMSTSTEGMRGGHVMRAGAVTLPSNELSVGSCFGHTSFFSELPSHCSVWSTTVIKVLVLNRSVYENLLTTFPHQTRTLLENMELHAEEEVRQEILSSLSGVTSITPELAAALKDMAHRDKRPSELTAAAMMEMRDLLDKPKRSLLDNLAKVKEALAGYVQKVDRDLVHGFLNACADGDVARTRTMLVAGMSPNVVDYDRRTGLMLCCKRGHEQVARLLLEAGADTQLHDAGNNTAMYECVKLGRDDLIELLLEFGGSLGMDSVAVASQLCDLVKQGNMPKLARFIHAGAPVNVVDYNGMSPLHVAVLCSNLSMVQLLVSDGGALLTARNVWGRTPLEEAQQSGDTSIVSFLDSLTNEAHAATQQLQRDMEFLDACSKGQTDQVHDALKRGQPPDTHDYDNRTALMLACHAGHTQLVKLLLQAGADPGLEDNFGHTAMWECVQQQHKMLVDLLLQYGGSLAEHPPAELANTMSNLVSTNNLSRLHLLIRAGASPDCMDYMAQTPLHVAAAMGNLNTVRLLLEEANATVDVQDVFGRTPLDCVLSAQALSDEPNMFDDVCNYLEPLTMAAGKGVIKNRLNPHALPAVLLLEDMKLPRVLPQASAAADAIHHHAPAAAAGTDSSAHQQAVVPAEGVHAKEQNADDDVLKLPVRPSRLIGKRSQQVHDLQGGLRSLEQLQHNNISKKAGEAAASGPAVTWRQQQQQGSHRPSPQDPPLQPVISQASTTSGPSGASRSRRASLLSTIDSVVRHLKDSKEGNTAGRHASLPASSLKSALSVRAAATDPTAAQELLEQLDKELGLSGLEEVLASEYVPLKSSTIAARATQGLKAGPGGMLQHPELSAPPPVNTAVLQRARRASQTIELAALQAGWPGLEPRLYTEMSIGPARTASQTSTASPHAGPSMLLSTSLQRTQVLQQSQAVTSKQSLPTPGGQTGAVRMVDTTPLAAGTASMVSEGASKDRTVHASIAQPVTEGGTISPRITGKANSDELTLPLAAASSAAQQGGGDDAEGVITARNVELQDTTNGAFLNAA